jgi:hypothetical protein
VQETRDISPVYATGGLDRELRQAEIITGLRQYSYDPVAGEGVEVPHPYVIVLSQDCDLLWDFEARGKQEPPHLNGVLLLEIWLGSEKGSRLPGSDVWKRIKQNKDDRYHFLEAAPPTLDLVNSGLPEMVVDFKRYFTLPPEEIYRQFALGAQGAVRRCRLEMPYREHLQSRAGFYIQRVMLPVDHISTDKEPFKASAPTLLAAAPARKD